MTGLKAKNKTEWFKKSRGNHNNVDDKVKKNKLEFDYF